MKAAPAFRSGGRACTAPEFYATACDPARNVVVEACAGSGKTWMLVSRIVRALLAGAQPHEILAITFTRKAAGEMRERLHEWLSGFARLDVQKAAEQLAMRGLADETGRCSAPELVPVLQNLYRETLKAGRPVQIATFHGWFAGLLRAAPVSVLDELGLPLNHQLVEDTADLVQQVWRRFHAAVAADAALRADFDATVAVHGRSQLREALQNALDKRVELAMTAPDTLAMSVEPVALRFPAFAAFDEPVDCLRDAGERAQWNAWAAQLGRESGKSAPAAANAMEEALGKADAQACMQALRLALFPKDKLQLRANLAGFAAAQDAEERLLEIHAAQHQHEAWLYHHRMLHLAQALVREFAALKRERGWVDMGDVELAAFRLLSSPELGPWVQRRLDMRVRHLLIDEFQDTNPLQWQALRAWLESYAGAGGGGQPAPSVFLVGDPKQSIYRFRRAEPEVFRSAQDFIRRQLDGVVLECDHTHRNAQPVIDAVNTVFARAQDAGEYEGFRDHTTASSHEGTVLALPRIPRPPKAARAAADDGVPAWRDTLLVPRLVLDETLRAKECDGAARWLAAQIAAGMPAKHIMVLARKRVSLGAMQDALRRHGILSQLAEKTALGDMPEVQDVVALLDALVSPGHDLSLARALRSPVFGLADDELVGLVLDPSRPAGQKAHVPWSQTLEDSVSLSPALAEVRDKLRRWRGLLSELPPHDLLARIYEDGGLLERFAAAAPATLRGRVVANLDALLGAALELDGARYATPYALVRALKAGSVEAPAPARADAVRLLTVHGAKGLEARCVLVIDSDPEASKPESMEVLLRWPGASARPQRFAFIARESAPPACCEDDLQLETAARRREELNGLYVAMTRARETLAFSSFEPFRGAAGSWWERAQPLAEAVDPAQLQSQPAGADAAAATAPFSLAKLPAQRISAGFVATNSIADKELEADSDTARVGRALHRMLERMTPSDTEPVAALRQRVAREFALSPDEEQRAVAMAQRIRGGEAAWTWDADVVDWHGNEVEMVVQGQLRRLDRLVRRRDSGEWWVLDYKSLRHPEQDEALVGQLRAYRAAVAAAYPGDAVQAAFVTAQGRLARVE